MTRSEALSWGRGIGERIATRDMPAEVLALVDERHGGRHCIACRAQRLATPADEPMEIDHMQPLSKGGDSHHLNLRWLCRSHNRARGDRRDPPAQPPRWARRRRA